MHMWTSRYLSGTFPTLHPQCSYLEFSHSPILFHHSNTSMSVFFLPHTNTYTHIYTHSYFIFTTFPFFPFLLFFLYMPVLSWSLWPPPCLLRSFRNFGSCSKILNQLQAATAPWAPSLHVCHPACWPQGVFVSVRKRGLTIRPRTASPKKVFADCHIAFAPGLFPPLCLISSLLYFQFVSFCHYLINCPAVFN